MALVEHEHEKAPKRDPLERPDYVKPDLFALRAVARGEATPEQQQRAVRFLLNGICATYDETFRPDSERLSAFASGRRWVGLSIVWFLNSAPVEVPGEKAP